MSLTLGVKPLKIDVQLTGGADFVASIKSADGTEWPAGAHAELRFNDPDATVWATTTDGIYLRWQQDKVAVDAVRAGNPSEARVFYVDTNGNDLCWSIGDVLG